MIKEKLKKIFHIDICVLFLMHTIFPPLYIAFCIYGFIWLLKMCDMLSAPLYKFSNIDKYFTLVTETLEHNYIVIGLGFIAAVILFIISQIIIYGIAFGRIPIFKKVFTYYEKNTKNDILKIFFDKLKYSYNFRAIWLLLTELYEIPIFIYFFYTSKTSPIFSDDYFLYIITSLIFNDTFLAYIAIFRHWKKEEEEI